MSETEATATSLPRREPAANEENGVTVEIMKTHGEEQSLGRHETMSTPEPK
jgi:hypothetical protein